MPASTRIHVSRPTSSRPYDRRSPTASQTQSQSLSHQSPPPASPIQNPESSPDHPGLPTYAEYKQIEAGYLHSLSPRKRDKALITQAMFDKIWDVLHQPEACTIETPQFRFWVRKMFTLSRPPTAADVNGEEQWSQWGSGPTTTTHARASDSDGEKQGEEEEAEDLELERAMGIARGTDADAALLTSAVVLHENRPVAIMEQLYELFCYCHVRAGHGGRDKTCAVIRQHYSWVPKELTAQFVKACPTCMLKRSGGGDLGVAVQRRAAAGGGRERRRKGTATGKEVSVGPPSPRWPTTGGPLDPANSQPYGVREDAEPIGPSPMGGCRTGSAPKEVPPVSCLSSGWNSMPQALTARVDTPPSPFHLCDPIHTLGTAGYPPQTFPVETAGSIQATRSPRTSGLPSLASALSNESLDDNVNLTGLGPNDALRCDAGGECLPPALRPLQLSGPIPSNTMTETETEDPDRFRIDPVLLSLSYAGLGHWHTHMSTGGSPGLGSSEADGQGLRLTLDPTNAGMTSEGEGYPGQDQDERMHPSGLYDDRLRLCVRESDGIMPALDTSDSPMTAYSDSPDSSFESGTSMVNVYRRHGTAIFKPLSFPSTSRHCGYGPGYDAPLGTMFLPCSTDDSDVGRELDGTLSRFSILTDA